MDDDVADSENESCSLSQSGHDLMKNMMGESLKREKEMRRLLDKEIMKNDQLRLELEIERKKTVVRGWFDWNLF